MRDLFYNCLRYVSKMFVMACFSLGLAIGLIVLSKIELGLEDDYESALNETLDDLASLTERKHAILFVPGLTI